MLKKIPLLCIGQAIRVIITSPWDEIRGVVVNGIYTIQDIDRNPPTNSLIKIQPYFIKIQPYGHQPTWVRADCCDGFLWKVVFDKPFDLNLFGREITLAALAARRQDHDSHNEHWGSGYMRALLDVMQYGIEDLPWGTARIMIGQ
jgi:hypothetical protein